MNKKQLWLNIKRTKTEDSYYAMIRRCHTPEFGPYEYYGGNGITVCERWRESIHNFVEDMGLRPSRNHTIDRIDSKGNYEPANCRWSGRLRQALNRDYGKEQGVRQFKQINKWGAHISIEGKQVHLGVYDKKEDAMKARKAVDDVIKRLMDLEVIS